MISVEALGQFPKYITKSENGHVFNSQSVGKSFERGASGVYRRREGATHRNSMVGSNRHLEVGHVVSDQRRLDCLKCWWSPVPGAVCSPFLEGGSQGRGSLCHGYSSVLM